MEFFRKPIIIIANSTILIVFSLNELFFVLDYTLMSLIITGNIIYNTHIKHKDLIIIIIMVIKK